MIKEDLRQCILLQLKSNHAIALAATKSAISDATDDETVPEHKYDTLAIEAAYLAHGQGRRLLECEDDIRLYTELVLRSFDNTSPIQVSALVTLLDHDEKQHYFFIGPASGGEIIDFNGQKIALLTVNAPLGQALLNKHVDDEIELSIAGKTITYDVIDVI